jgi:hypothetical protein
MWRTPRRKRSISASGGDRSSELTQSAEFILLAFHQNRTGCAMHEFKLLPEADRPHFSDPCLVSIKHLKSFASISLARVEICSAGSPSRKTERQKKPSFRTCCASLPSSFCSSSRCSSSTVHVVSLAEQSEATATYAAELAKCFGASLTLDHVHDPVPLYEYAL